MSSVSRRRVGAREESDERSWANMDAQQQSIKIQTTTGDAIVPENRVNCVSKGNGESDLNRHERADAIGEISHGSHDIDVAGQKGPADVSTSSDSRLR